MRTIAHVYTHPTFKKLGQILGSVRIERGGSVSLYRVVGEAELKDIEATGGFGFSYGTSEIKGFLGSLDEAMQHYLKYAGGKLGFELDR